MLIMSTLVGISLHKDNEIYAESIDVHSHIVDEDRLSANHAQLHLAAARQKNKVLEQETTTGSIQGTISIQVNTTELPEAKDATSMTTSPKEQTAESSDTSSVAEAITTSPDAQPITPDSTQNTTQDSLTQHADNSQNSTAEQENSDTQQTTAVAQTATQSATESIPSSGMYIDGISSQIGTYSIDGGQVPTYTPYAYWWNTPEMASHNYYLVDNSNSNGLGQKVLALHTGDPVYLNGSCYHVTSSVTVYPGQYASQYFDFSHHLYIQTCYGANASDGMRTVILD